MKQKNLKKIVNDRRRKEIEYIMDNKQMEKVLNSGIKSLKSYLSIPYSIVKKTSSSKYGYEQLSLDIRYDTWPIEDDNSVDMAMRAMAKRLNYRNRFSKHGRISIPKKKLAVIFRPLEIPDSTRGMIGDNDNIPLRICIGHDMIYHISHMRFDVLVKFINKLEL